MQDVSDLFIRGVKGQDQYNISHLQFQLIAVSGSVIMYRFYLEQKYSQNEGFNWLWTDAGTPTSVF